MARPGLLQHRKFRRLARAVGSTALALGSLELVWSSAYESGDDYLGDEIDVESAAQWQGEPGALATALASAGGAGSVGFMACPGAEWQGRAGQGGAGRGWAGQGKARALPPRSG